MLFRSTDAHEGGRHKTYKEAKILTVPVGIDLGVSIFGSHDGKRGSKKRDTGSDTESSGNTGVRSMERNSPRAAAADHLQRARTNENGGGVRQQQAGATGGVSGTSSGMGW